MSCAFSQAHAGEVRHLAQLPVEVASVVVGDATRAPTGWLDFCKAQPAECRTDLDQPERITLDAPTWKLVSSVNVAVNAEIEPVTDQDHWGQVERWSLPIDGRGDCEDYALLKRKRLADAGLPRRALLMTVVIDETGGGHAILTVRTDRGDFMLDNRRSSILSASDTNYRFVKREGQTGEGWVGIGDGPSTTVATAAR